MDTFPRYMLLFSISPYALLRSESRLMFRDFNSHSGRRIDLAEQIGDPDTIQIINTYI